MRDPIDIMPDAACQDISSYKSRISLNESQISEVLGVPWTITFDPNLLCNNADGEHDRLGYAIHRYMEPLATHFERWSEEVASEGVEELNSLVPNHVVELRPQGILARFKCGGLVIHGDALVLAYREGRFAVGCIRASEPEAIKAAIIAARVEEPVFVDPLEILPVEARDSIRDEWGARQEELRKTLADLITVPELQLRVRWETIVAGIICTTSDHDPERVRKAAELGRTVQTYFEGMMDYLQGKDFALGVDMQETFWKAIKPKKIGLRVLDGKVRCIVSNPYSETTVEDGVLWTQTSAEEWGILSSSLTQHLVDELHGAVVGFGCGPILIMSKEKRAYVRKFGLERKFGLQDLPVDFD